MKQSIVYIIKQLKHQKGHEMLMHARSVLERAIKELDRYIVYLEKADSDTEKAKIISWALHYLTCNILTNVRLDLIADEQAEFRQQVVEILTDTTTDYSTLNKRFDVTE